RAHRTRARTSIAQTRRRRANGVARRSVRHRGGPVVRPRRARRRTDRARGPGRAERSGRRAPILRRLDTRRDGGGAQSVVGHGDPGLAPGQGVAAAAPHRELDIMTGSRWGRIEQLYHAALDREPKDRAAFLDQGCAEDTTLRREVASLVEADEDAAAFLAE